MLAEISAVVFCVAAVCATGLHLSLVAGAPWGHMTMGGQIEGQLPVPMRFASLLQAALLAVLALVVLGHAGVIQAPKVLVAPWTIWVAVSVSVLAVIGNSATRSRPERLFGVPVSLSFLLGSLGVALFSSEAV